MREGLRSAYSAGATEIDDLENNPADKLTIALAWVAAREARDKVFGAYLFINPAWDILLTLFVNHLRGKSSAVTQVCQASTAPITTALRWIAALEAQHLVRRIPDPRDRRRTFLALTSEGLQGMEMAIDDAVRTAPGYTSGGSASSRSITI